MKKPLACDWCGKSLGVGEHNYRLDGPLSCGARECNRAIAEGERAERDEARARAEDDDYGMYRR